MWRYTILSGITERTLEKCKRERKGNVREMGLRIVDKVFSCSEWGAM
jgi:hypothetical protein